MSAHLQWMVVRNCSSFLLKRNNQTYSTVSAGGHPEIGRGSGERAWGPLSDTSGPPKPQDAALNLQRRVAGATTAAWGPHTDPLKPQKPQEKVLGTQ